MKNCAKFVDYGILNTVFHNFMSNFNDIIGIVWNAVWRPVQNTFLVNIGNMVKNNYKPFQYNDLEQYRNNL
jgi:hypothetical protein